MHKITKKAAPLCPSVLAGALLVAGLSTGCEDRPPPCNPEGEGNGTVGPTPPPVFGPGGPGTPPDRDAPETNSDAPETNSDAPETYSDAPETYSTNAAGDVCVCSPYQSGCSATPAAPKSCEKACKAGYARFDQYCQNEAPDALRSRCEQSAQQALYSCSNSRPDKGCDGPCTNLQLVFQPFCRDYAKNDACWSASNKGYGECKAKG
jgi:hypothetical protein